MTIIVGETERKALKAALARARSHQVPWEVLQRGIADSQDGDTASIEDPLVTPFEFVDLPFGYVAAISFEEQPAGVLARVGVEFMAARGAEYDGLRDDF